MATTMDAVDNILKEVYEDQIVDQMQSEAVTTKRIEKTSKGVTQDAVGGKYTTFPIRVARNHGRGARNEMDALPEAGTQHYRSVRLNLKHLYGAIQLTGQTFELAKTNRQAFATALDEEIKGMKEGLVKDVNRQVYGTSEGIIATATGTSAAGIFVTDNVQYLEHEMFIDVYNDSDVIQESKGIITEIEEISAGVWHVTFTASDGTASAINPDTDWTMTIHGSRGKEKTGFAQILNLSGDFDELYNVEHSVWTPNLDTSVGALSEGRMIKMANTIRRRGGKTTVIFTTHGVLTAYFNLLVQQRRYSNTKEFAGGFSGLAFTTSWGEIPVVPDFDCPPGLMHYINEDEIKLYQAGEWQFMNRTGSNWTQVHDSDGDYDAYKSRFFKYCEIGISRRNTHGAMTGVDEAE